MGFTLSHAINAISMMHIIFGLKDGSLKITHTGIPLLPMTLGMISIHGVKG
jgi:hypothetical protein